MKDNSSKERIASVNVDDIIGLFCDINNMFINVRGNLMGTEESKTKVIHVRQLEIKRKLADMLNKAYGFNNFLDNEYHPFELKRENVKKILENAKIFL